MTVEYMQAIRRRYERLGYAPYRWFEADSAPPWQPLAKPLAEARVGLLSTCGAYALGYVDDLRDPIEVLRPDLAKSGLGDLDAALDQIHQVSPTGPETKR